MYANVGSSLPVLPASGTDVSWMKKIALDPSLSG